MIQIHNWFYQFLSAMSLRCTSKDLNFLPFSFSSSFFFETKSWQKHKFLSDSNKLPNFNNTNKEFLPKKNPPKKSSQKNPPRKILPKNPSKKSPQKNPPKKILPERSSQKIPRKILKLPPWNPEKIQNISKNFSKSS